MVRTQARLAEQKCRGHEEAASAWAKLMAEKAVFVAQQRKWMTSAMPQGHGPRDWVAPDVAELAVKPEDPFMV